MMPLPRALARANRVGFNRVSRHVAPHLPGFGVVHHVGRRSGAHYDTPVNVFARDGGYALALTYGPESEWVRNVVAADGAVVTTRGEDHRVANPRVVQAPDRPWVPRPVRGILGLLDVDSFLLVDEVPAA
jgi:deazaflavin-dependent oxidoreductase (nitroreductase family)